jgi:hypothetical protein
VSTPHHQTFACLVNEQTGFVGRVAYTFYKNDKLAWIRGFHDKHGRAPSDEELALYFHIGINQARLDAYLAEAERTLNEFIDLTASEEIRRGIEAYQQSDVVKRCENILNGSKKTTWQAVKESLLSSVLSSFIITGLSVLLYLGSVAVFDDFRGLIHRLTAPNPAGSSTQPSSPP